MKSLKRSSILFKVALLALVALVGNGVASSSHLLEVSLTDADVTFVAEQAGDWAAYSVTPAGDVNGDGFDDFLVGAPLYGSDPEDPTIPREGKAYLILGRPQGQWPAGLISLSQANASFLGCGERNMTGRKNYTAGDVNGDGYDDFLISGWKCDSGLEMQGKAYLFLGRPNIDWDQDFPVEQADASFLGEGEWDWASYYVCTAGDVNADGYDDFLITATRNDEAGLDSGQVYLILGRPEADWGMDYPLAQADASFLGEAEDDRLGRSAAGAGDVNGDGYDDFLIGSISSDDGGVDAGESYLFLGRAREADNWWGMDYSVAGAEASFIGEAAYDEVGRRVAGAGDVNGDEYDDLLLAASRNDQAGADAGKAYLILGGPAADWGTDYPLALADASFLGESNGDQAGRRVSGAGDVNHDGYSDFLIGAPHNARGGMGAGTAYLIYGRPAADWGRDFSLTQADVAYVGKAEVGRAGFEVSEGGDVDGDGIEDLLIGAYGGRNNTEVLGEAYVLLDGDAPLPLEFTPDAPLGRVGEWHSFTGDYWEPNGWRDIAEAQLVLDRQAGDLRGINVKYDASSNGLYLHEHASPGWVGPCAPGEAIVLSNGVVQLDCRRSSVSHHGPRRLQVTWNTRWILPLSGSRKLKAHLRAVDLSGNDSGFVESGTWSLVVNVVYVPLVMK